jgi:hypothetical protein
MFCEQSFCFDGRTIYDKTGFDGAVGNWPAGV